MAIATIVPTIVCQSYMKIYWKIIFRFYCPMASWTLLSHIEKPFYCGVLDVAIITDPAAQQAGGTGGVNPSLSEAFF